MNGEITKPRRWRWPVSVAAVAAAAAIVFALQSGVSLDSPAQSAGESTGTQAPTSSVERTLSPSPSITPPQLPIEARKRTREGARQFLGYFFKVYDYSFLALDTQLLAEVSSSECKFCRSASETVEKIRAAGSHIEGGRVTVLTSVVVPTGKPETGLVVNSYLRQEKSQTIAADGSVRSRAKESERRLDALVRWEEGKWVLVGVDTPTQ